MAKFKISHTLTDDSNINCFDSLDLCPFLAVFLLKLVRNILSADMTQFSKFECFDRKSAKKS